MAANSLEETRCLKLPESFEFVVQQLQQLKGSYWSLKNKGPDPPPFNLPVGEGLSWEGGGGVSGDNPCDNVYVGSM